MKTTLTLFLIFIAINLQAQSKDSGIVAINYHDTDKMLTITYLDRMQMRYPKPVLKFRKWFFQYLIKNNWRDNGIMTLSMQTGVWVQYMIDQNEVPEIDYGNYELRKDFEWWIKDENKQLQIK